MSQQTQIAIIGAGPAGLTLALLLQRANIGCVVLESRSRDYVESRVRAGLLEQNTVDLFRELGVADRLDREGMPHKGVILSFEGERHRIPFDELTGGRHITIYGQQEVVKDMIAACINRGIDVRFDSEVDRLENVATPNPVVHLDHLALHCEFIAGCDGFHGISRSALPAGSFRTHSLDYPFSWLGVLAEAPPSTEELIYAYSDRGFALHSVRSSSISRLYLQVDNDDHIDNWSDDRIWRELARRLHSDGFHLTEGPVLEKGITPMRTFMIDNMQYGNLFLAGDAAHIVPPTGGKGLNLAVADIGWLAEAFISFYRDGSKRLLDQYSGNALRRVWRAQDFSNFMTYLFHKQAEKGSFEYGLQRSRFEYLKVSRPYATSLAENYVGLKEI